MMRCCQAAMCFIGIGPLLLLASSCHILFVKFLCYQSSYKFSDRVGKSFSIHEIDQSLILHWFQTLFDVCQLFSFLNQGAIPLHCKALASRPSQTLHQLRWIFNKFPQIYWLKTQRGSEMPYIPDLAPSDFWNTLVKKLTDYVEGEKCWHFIKNPQIFVWRQHHVMIRSLYSC